MTGIKSGDIVKVNVKLTAVAVGHDVKCLYKRPDGSTRPIYIPAECLEVAQDVEKNAAEIGPMPTPPDDYQTHGDLATGHDKTVTAYKCLICGKVCKAAIGLSGHMRSHKA